MTDIENPESDEGHIPLVSDVEPLSDTHISTEDSNELKPVTILESLELNLCLATFVVEAVSSIGTDHQHRWEEKLGTETKYSPPGKPDIENLKGTFTNTPLQETASNKLTSSSIAEVIDIYKSLEVRKNVDARLQLMSWAVADNQRSKLKRQAAMLCNLSNAHYYVMNSTNICENNDDCRLKWVSVEVLKLWLGQEFVRNVFLSNVLNDDFAEDLRLSDNEIENILRGDFLATLALYGETAIDLQHEKFPKELRNYLSIISASSRSDPKVKEGPLIPPSRGDVTRFLIYARTIQKEKEDLNLDSPINDYELTVFTQDELEELKENTISDPFSYQDWDNEIQINQRRLLRRRQKFEKKIAEIVRNPFGTIVRGKRGRQFIGVILILSVIAVIVVTYERNPVRRQYNFERFFDAFEIGTILIAIITILVKAISPDSSVLRNSMLGRKLISELKQVRQYCNTPTQKEFCFLLALKERNYRWLSEENLSFVSGSLSGEIRNDDEIQLFQLTRMGFTTEGGYVFNPYVGKYFRINKDFMSGGHLKPIEVREIPTFESQRDLLQERVPCSYIIR